MAVKRIVIRALDRIGLLSYLLYFYQGHLKGFHIDTYLSNLRTEFGRS